MIFQKIKFKNSFTAHSFSLVTRMILYPLSSSEMALKKEWNFFPTHCFNALKTIMTTKRLKKNGKTAVTNRERIKLLLGPLLIFQVTGQK